MKKILALAMLAMVAIPNFAQLKLEFKSFDENQTDLKARTKPRIDKNGNPSAILKIQIPMLPDAMVESNYMLGDQVYTPGEFTVYLAEGAKKVVVKHPDFEPFTYQFPSPLKGKSAYTLVLQVPEEYRSLGQVAVMIKTNATKSKLRIDGESYVSDNGRYEIKLKPGQYEYTLTADNPDFKELEGTLTVTDDDMLRGLKDVQLSLATTKSANVHFNSTPGATITVDGAKMEKWEKKSFSLPIGRHEVIVTLPNATRSFQTDLTSGDVTLDVDLRNRLKFVSPVAGEFSIKPIGDAIAPNVSKFKTGEEIRVLGSYELTAKCKGYDQMSMTLDMPLNTVGGNHLVEKMVPMKSKADNLLATGSSAKAEKEYQKLVKNPADDIARLNYGKYLLKQGNYDGSPNSGSLSNSRAIVLLEESASLGNPEACYIMADFTPDKKLAEKYLRTAAAGQIADSYLRLGRMLYSQGRYEEAYKELMNDNSGEAAVLMTAALCEMKNPASDEFENAIKRITNITARDEANFQQAQAMLGHLYFNGKGVAKNVPLAMKYWKELSPKAFNYSDDLLVMAAENINDKPKSASYLKNVYVEKYKDDYTIYNGITLSKLLSWIGQYHSVPNTKDTDAKLAFRYVAKAYEIGDRSQNTLRIIGKSFKDGTGVGKDRKGAIKYLTEAVNQYKDVDALRWLGNIYENDKDFTKAQDYYTQAIEQGDVASLGFLGTLRYNSGNKTEGVRLWTEAAQKGHRASVDKLITYYEKVKRNNAEANKWKEVKKRLNSQQGAKK